MRLLILCLVSVMHLSLSAQKLQYNEITETSDSILSKTFGTELMDFFEIQPRDLILFYSRNKSRLQHKSLRQHKAARTENLKEVWVEYSFTHPNLPASIPDIHFVVELDNELRLINPLDPNRIPRFLKQGEKCNWVEGEDQQNIIDNLKFEKTSKSKFSRIEYHHDDRRYYLNVYSQYGLENGYYLYEIFMIAMDSGETVRHEFKQVHSHIL